jgi:hypothetical protein
MDNAVWLVLLVGLGCAWLIVRRAARQRQRRMIAERERARSRRPKIKPKHMSHRTEMRAYDDPSTLMGEITTRGSHPPTTTQPSLAPTATTNGGVGSRRPADAGRTRPTGKPSPAGGKPRG